MEIFVFSRIYYSIYATAEWQVLAHSQTAGQFTTQRNALPPSAIGGDGDQATYCIENSAELCRHVQYRAADLELPDCGRFPRV
jgi:hypothetical protein